MLIHSRLTRAAAVIALLAIAVFRFGDRAMAIQDSEDKILFGPLGITRGERALVNVYVVATSPAIGNPDILPPWEFALRVFNRRGDVVQEENFRLRVGSIRSVEVTVQGEENSLLIPMSRRTFRAEIVGFNPQPDPPGKYAATLEVIDRVTGRTSLLLGGPDTLPAEHHQ